MDAVVIGGGVNELAAAHYLARAGRRVLVLAPTSANDEFDPGWIPPRVVRELGLARAGLAVESDDPWVTAPLSDGGRLELWRDMARSVQAIRRVSPRDAARWPEFCERMAALAGVLERLYGAPPPDLLAPGWPGLARLAGTGLTVRRSGRHTVEDLMRLLPMPAADLLDDWFECDALKGILGAAAVAHVRHGPRACGTAFRLVHQHVGSPVGVFRPPRSNVARVLSGLPGIELRLGVNIARITAREERVAGVELASGEPISTPVVISGLDPARTLTELLDPGWLDPAFARAVRNIRCRGVAARAALTLDHAPGFRALVVAPSLEYLERAADDAKYGHVSFAPYLEARDGGPAGDGQHRIDVHVQYAPYALGDGAWDDVARSALARSIRERLVQYVPALASAIIADKVSSPLDLEREYGYPEGQVHHAELMLDQALWMRPVPAAARYATPLHGLYLCGMATHPGAGVLGASGASAAREVLRDSRGGSVRRESARHGC